MFGWEGAAIGAIAAINGVKAEKQLVEKMRERLPPGQFNTWFTRYLEVKKEAERYAVEERRHRELCDAIRNSGGNRFFFF